MLVITMTTEIYHRTESGKNWRRRPTETETKTIDRRFYDNVAGDDALRFWNGFCGGTCRAERGYTCIGFVPIRVSRVNPARDTKVVDHFRIQYVN